MSVSKEAFIAYEAVRESGVTNMYDTRKVSFYADIADEDVMYIIKNYSSLAKVYLTPITTRLALVKAKEIRVEAGLDDEDGGILPPGLK